MIDADFQPAIVVPSITQGQYEQTRWACGFIHNHHR